MAKPAHDENNREACDARERSAKRARDVRAAKLAEAASKSAEAEKKARVRSRAMALAQARRVKEARQYRLDRKSPAGKSGADLLAEMVSKAVVEANQKEGDGGSDDVTRTSQSKVRSGAAHAASAAMPGSCRPTGGSSAGSGRVSSSAILDFASRRFSRGGMGSFERAKHFKSVAERGGYV